MTDESTAMDESETTDDAAGMGASSTEAPGFGLVVAFVAAALLVARRRRVR